MLCSTHWATQALQRPLTTAVLMSCSATEEHSRGVYVALSALMSCAFSFHPAQDWWSGRVTCRECCDVLRSPPGQQGDRGPFSTTTSAVTLMKDGLALVWSECFIMVMYGAAGLAPALGRVCVHLCGSLAKCFPSVKRCCCSVLFPPLDLHHRAGGLHYSLNSIHDFMENHSPKWSCLFSFSHLNTQEKG